MCDYPQPTIRSSYFTPLHYEMTETVTAGYTLLLHSYLFQRFQPCLPPCCSLLCPQCPLFCWWQLLLIIFITQEPLCKEYQSGLHSRHVWTTNILNIIIILQIHQSLNNSYNTVPHILNFCTWCRYGQASHSGHSTWGKASLHPPNPSQYLLNWRMDGSQR